MHRLVVTLVLLLLAAPARAESVESDQLSGDGPDLYRRPRFSLAVGLGASIDHTAGNPHADRPQPAFFFTAGLGDGLFGLDLRSFGNGATKVQVTRVSLEAVLALRPFALLPPRLDYPTRVVRTLALDVGPCLERVAKDVKSDWRSGPVVGTHVDLPLGYADATKELRVRLGLRHLFATTGSLTSVPVTNSDLELYGQLTFVF